MNFYKCPECNCILEYLKYSVTCTEYGDYQLVDNPENENDAYSGDHDCNDSENNGDTEYTCPECDHPISPRTLVIESDDDDDDEDEEEQEHEEELTEEEKEELEFERAKVITPTSDNIEELDITMIPKTRVCTNKKCRNLIIIPPYHNDNEIDCQKCGETVSIE